MNNLAWNDFAAKVSDYLGIDQADLHEDTDLYEDLCIDSLGIFSLGTYLTDQYHLTVALSSVAVVSTLGEMFNTINEKGIPEEKGKNGN